MYMYIHVCVHISPLLLVSSSLKNAKISHDLHAFEDGKFNFEEFWHLMQAVKAGS